MFVLFVYGPAAAGGSESRKRFGKLTDPGLYHEIHAAGGFDYGGTLTPSLRIDTDAVSAPEAAAEIVAALEAWQ